MKNGDILTIKIYNTKGSLVRNITGVENFSTKELKSGFYIITFVLKNSETKRQFIKL